MRAKACSLTSSKPVRSTSLVASRIIDLEKHRSRLHVIENEFHRAEQREEWMQKDEERARHLGRCKRFTEIETQRDHEKVDRRREGKRLQLELDKAEQ